MNMHTYECSDCGEIWMAVSELCCTSCGSFNIESSKEEDYKIKEHKSFQEMLIDWEELRYGDVLSFNSEFIDFIKNNPDLFSSTHSYINSNIIRAPKCFPIFITQIQKGKICFNFKWMYNRSCWISLSEDGKLYGFDYGPPVFKLVELR